MPPGGFFYITHIFFCILLMGVFISISDSLGYLILFFMGFLKTFMRNSELYSMNVLGSFKDYYMTHIKLFPIFWYWGNWGILENF